MLSYSPKKIISLRKALGLNESALARKAGLSANTIWGYEHGEIKMPKFATLDKIAAALGVTMPKIMAEEQPSDIDDQIKAALGALSQPNKAAMLAAAKALLESQNKHK